MTEIQNLFNNYKENMELFNTTCFSMRRCLDKILNNIYNYLSCNINDDFMLYKSSDKKITITLEFPEINNKRDSLVFTSFEKIEGYCCSGILITIRSSNETIDNKIYQIKLFETMGNGVVDFSNGLIDNEPLSIKDSYYNNPYLTIMLDIFNNAIKKL